MMSKEANDRGLRDPGLCFNPKRIGRDGHELRYKADAEMLRALTAELDVLSVDALSCSFELYAFETGGAKIEGRIHARVHQESVVTLEPVERLIDERLALRFVPEGSRAAANAKEMDVSIDPLDEDPPETFSGDTIDLAPYVFEFLSLALDPYPREESAIFEAVDTDPQPQRPSSPFDALGALVDRKQDE